jgi:hypothetical protein
VPRITEFPEFERLPTEKDIEKFEYLSPALDSLHDELSKLSGKKQDAPVSAYKIKMVNRVLAGIKNIIGDDPALNELELLSDEELPQNSDVVLLLGQFRAAMGRLKNAFFGYDDMYGSDRWFTKENPPRFLEEDEDEVEGEEDLD